MRVRYRLRDPDMLRRVMDTPGRGVPYTVRTLAEAAQLKPGLVGHLVSGRNQTCDMEAAHVISEALGVAVLVLFEPPTSPDPHSLTQSGIDKEEECASDPAPHPASSISLTQSPDLASPPGSASAPARFAPGGTRGEARVRGV